jgi:chemotaxis family two-component system sensor kinase Cph1
LQEVLDDTLLFLKSRIEQNNVRIVVPRSLPQANVDAVRVGEVFTNLISNAIKYNVQPEKIIEIGAIENVTQNIAGANQIERILYVKDNGIGIEEKFHNSIFRIFKRLHGRNEYGGGTGAGLNIVKKIIERHNGRIWLESEIGEGTVFYFTLE